MKIIIFWKEARQILLQKFYTDIVLETFCQKIQKRKLYKLQNSKNRQLCFKHLIALTMKVEFLLIGHLKKGCFKKVPSINLLFYVSWPFSFKCFPVEWKFSWPLNWWYNPLVCWGNHMGSVLSYVYDIM